MERFDNASAAEAPASLPLRPSAQTNGKSFTIPKKVKTESIVKKEQTHSETPDDEDDEGASPKKKRKQVKVKEDEDPDAKLAAMLQAEENTRSRATRGGGAKKKGPVKKRAPKKKSSDKVKAEDDSDIELNSDGEVKEKVKKGGFHKQYNLSYPLAELIGETSVSSVYNHRFCYCGKLICTVLPSSSRPENLDVYQSERPSSAIRQTTNQLR